MEVTGSEAAGFMRVGLQIASNHRGPVLEFYYEVRNRFGSEFEYDSPVGVEGTKTQKNKIRSQNVFIQFSIVNIGGVRAENVEFEITGELRRSKPREGFGSIMESEIPQMAPGQLIHLFQFHDHDLNIYPEEGGSSIGIKSDHLQIVAKYNGPQTFINRILSFHTRIMGKKQYESKFIFKPEMVLCGDLPPAEYA